MLSAVVALGLVASAEGSDRSDKLQKINHFVVIYQENHSFDNLYGGWEGVRGLSAADPEHTVQMTQGGLPYECLLQDDVNLTSLPLATSCTETTGKIFQSAFVNKPFLIDAVIGPADTTCPPPGSPFMPNGLPNGTGLPGGCTRDIVHRFLSGAVSDRRRQDGPLRHRQ